MMANFWTPGHPGTWDGYELIKELRCTPGQPSSLLVWLVRYRAIV